MVKNNTRISFLKIFLISLIIFGQAELRTRVSTSAEQETYSNLEQFKSDVFKLLDLILGIRSQAKFFKNFDSAASTYFGIPRERIKFFLRVRHSAVSKKLLKFYEDVQKLKLQTKLQDVQYPINALSYLSTVPTDMLTNRVYGRLIEKYVQSTNELKNKNLSFSLPSFDYFLHTEFCLGGRVELKDLYSCYVILNNNYSSMINRDLNQLRYLLQSYKIIETYIANYHKIEFLQVMMSMAVLLVKNPQLSRMVPDMLRSMNQDLKNSEPALEKNNTFLSRALMDSTFGTRFNHNKGSRDHLRNAIEAFNYTRLMNILGEDQMTKLEIGLKSLKLFFEKFQNIDKIMKKSTRSRCAARNVAYALNKVETLIGIGNPAIQDSLIHAIEKCIGKFSTSIQRYNPTSGRTFLEFQKAFQAHQALALKLEVYLDHVHALTRNTPDIVKVFSKVSSIVKSWRLSPLEWRRLQERLEYFLDDNGSKEIMALMFNTDIVYSLLNINDNENFKSKIRNLPSTDRITEILKKTNVSNVISISHCLFESNISFEDIDGIFKGMHHLKEFNESKLKAVVNITTKYVRSAKKMAEILNNAKELTKKKGLQSEWTRLDKFDYKNMVTKIHVGVDIIMVMTRVLKEKKILEKVIDLNLMVSGEVLKEWMVVRNGIKATIEAVENLDKFISEVRNNSISNVFKEAAKITGLESASKKLDRIKTHVKKRNDTHQLELLEKVNHLHLDFTEYRKDLKSASKSSETLLELLGIFIYINELARKEPNLQHVAGSWKYVMIIIIAVSLIILAAVFIQCCLLASGRKRMKSVYLTRFASQETLELQWRYSFWLDQESDKNILCEAVREINFEQVKTAVDKGSFINVYNVFGNTPLHAATKYGHVKIVKYLIKNGADRNAYNIENKIPKHLLDESLDTVLRLSTAIQTVDEASISLQKDMEKFMEIEKIFEKYKNKKFYQRMPDLLPTMSYRIRIDTRMDELLCNPFIESYNGNVTDQMSGVTHFIVQTGSNGVFESDEFGYIMCVFLPTILMKQQWMRACLEKKSNFRNDYKFRVEKVKYKGVVYRTVLKWAAWIHKQYIPFLFGVHIHMQAGVKSENERIQMKQLVEMHGAVWLDEVPVKAKYNIGSHPYHHCNLGPLFIIHDKPSNMEIYQNDAHKMYTVLTFDQLIDFMLKMECSYDKKRKVPIPVSNEKNEP